MKYLIPGAAAAIAPLLPTIGGVITMDAKGFHLFPDFVDDYIHLRKPGIFYIDPPEAQPQGSRRLTVSDQTIVWEES